MARPVEVEDEKKKRMSWKVQVYNFVTIGTVLVLRRNGECWLVVAPVRPAKSCGLCPMSCVLFSGNDSPEKPFGGGRLKCGFVLHMCV